MRVSIDTAVQRCEVRKVVKKVSRVQTMPASKSMLAHELLSSSVN